MAKEYWKKTIPGPGKSPGKSPGKNNFLFVKKLNYFRNKTLLFVCQYSEYNFSIMVSKKM
jgi:hypothetical protein